MKNIAKQISNQKTLGPYVIIFTVIWEFFSYFGMRALLILYLTQKLDFSDQNAYSVFGAFTSLVFVTPIIGGWIADRYLGYRQSIIVGAILIMCGHFILGFSTLWSLYMGLSFIICGVGFFKSNAICQIGEYFSDAGKKSSAFTLYYVGGNLGATISPIVCGYIATQFGWRFGFATAAVGMLFGLAALFYFRKHLQNVGRPKILWFKNNKLNKKLILIFITALVVSLVCVDVIIYQLWAGIFLLLVSAIAGLFAYKAYILSNKDNRCKLVFAFVLTLFGTLFWIFDMQGSSSISLFILRFVNRDIFSHNIPAAAFQSINPAVIIIFGSTIALVLRFLAKKNIKIMPATQVLFGILLLTAGFWIIALSASHAVLSDKSSMWWLVSGLTLIGTAEIFIDPVILVVINKAAPEKSLGALTGVYYLFVGAIANYLAAQFAKLAAPVSQVKQVTTALPYQKIYYEVVYIGILLMLLLIIIRWAAKRIVPLSREY